ncbi:MAG: DUF1972 domain-containing protein [Acetatifactor sp.]|nr:DUF1972 domain-containing protein [Acetatifactor sp.]
MRFCYIVGSKGFGNYGGYETFVDKLTECHKNNKEIQYFVACKGSENSTFIHNNAVGFYIKVPNIGPAQAIYYDVKALQWCIKHIRDNHVEHPIVYILACRIGPFAKYFEKQIHQLGGKLYVNPDGHEWMRGKWSAPVRKYWKHSERLMVKHCDLLICDSINMEKYIQEEYKQYHPKTTFIPYGSEVTPSTLTDGDKKYLQWLSEHELIDKKFYCSVGRFVPENNFETMIREFMRSKTDKDFAIITTKNDAFLELLDQRLHFSGDKRIKFVGTVYDQELLKKIRENAYGYFHGHEVGGTNPSLLEALGATKLNMLYDVGFNKEVAEEAALYWSKEDGNLAALIDKVDLMPEKERNAFGIKAKNRIEEAYSWPLIANKYSYVFQV